MLKWSLYWLVMFLLWIKSERRSRPGCHTGAKLNKIKRRGSSTEEKILFHSEILFLTKDPSPSASSICVTDELDATERLISHKQQSCDLISLVGCGFTQWRIIQNPTEGSIPTQTSYSTISDPSPALLALVQNPTALPSLPGVVVSVSIFWTVTKCCWVLYNHYTIIHNATTITQSRSPSPVPVL